MPPPPRAPGAQRERPALPSAPTVVAKGFDWNSDGAVEAEKYFAFIYGKAFHERGPPPPKEGGPETWRGQAWREEGQRWGNRGGGCRNFWFAYHSTFKDLPPDERWAAAADKALREGGRVPEDRKAR